MARLVAAGAIARAPASQRDLQAVQEAFNALQQSSGAAVPAFGPAGVEHQPSALIKPRVGASELLLAQ